MPAADLILKNARVITVDPARPRAGLVAVKGDGIIVVAGDESLESVRGAGSKVIDCQGKTVVPGFNDAHCHISSLVRKLLNIDLSPSFVRSIGDIREAVFRAAQKTPPGQWLTGTGYNDFYLTEKRHPNRWDIDEVAPDNPVVLSHHSLHACVLNSRALALVGINPETEEPPGAFIERDPDSGEPNGLLFEMLGFVRHEVMPALSGAELVEGLDLANRHYLSQGITSLQYTSPANDFGRWQELGHFKDSGQLKSRLSMMCGIEALSQFQEAGLECGSGDSHLRLGGVKIIVNMTSGQIHPTPKELRRQVLEAHRAGFQLAIHSVEQETLEATIEALEYAGNELPQIGRRHRIEHCSECPPPLLERLKALEAMVVTQPPFLYYGGERYLATVPVDRLSWLYRIKSLLDEGLVVAASSDSPVVPDNPLVGIYSAVTRRAESGQQLLPEECVSAGQALAMYTINAAYASFEEDQKGSITEGKLADLVLLSDDPTGVPPGEIKDIKVEMAIIGGEVVWER